MSGPADKAARKPRFETLFEMAGLTSFELPSCLERIYGGSVGFEPPALFTNFVASIDGVVALEGDAPPSVIRGASPADLFLMGLLRACADTVLIGASTLRSGPKHLWDHEAVFPEMATAFSRLRRTLGLPGSPQLVVLSRSGDLDPSIRALEAGALVITTDAGKANLKGKLPAAATILSRGPEVRIGEVVEVLRRQGGRLILSEGGPHVLGQLLEARVVDELFLTVAPTLTGRCFSRRRLGLIEGFALDLQELAGTDLLSVKRDTSHLFLRYRIRCFSSA